MFRSLPPKLLATAREYAQGHREPAAPRDAATVLLLRSGADGPEVFMMVRHHEIEFSSGALVFPGGSVDAADREIIARPELYAGGEGSDEAALSFRIAAIRETFEESGILLARPRGSKDLVEAKQAARIEAAHRAALAERKTTFLQVLSESGMVLALDELVPYAPSLTEWKVTAGIWAFGMMVFTVALKVGLRTMTGELRAPNAPALSDEEPDAHETAHGPGRDAKEVA